MGEEVGGEIEALGQFRRRSIGRGQLVNDRQTDRIAERHMER
jgi:hypothetical protein